GVIGAGMIGNFHARALEEMNSGKLVAVCDVSDERAKAYGEQHGCAAYTDIEEFLAHDGLDVVTIGTPSGLHLDPVKKAAAAKKHIICEKPLEVNIEKADELIAACEENGVVLSGVFPRRFQPAVVLLKETIESGRFGQITMANAYIKWFRTQEYYDSGGWRGTWDLDGGGALMNQSIHTVDRLLHFMGDVTSVCAFAKRAAHERIEVEDITVAILEFKSGALGTIEATTNCFSQTGHPAEVHICGNEGSVFLKDNNFSVWDFKDETEEDDRIRADYGVQAGAEGVGAADPTAIDFEGHMKNFEDAVKAIRGEGEPMVGGREARRSIELIQAVYQSAQSG
ncbi:MAG: Gfo/Idh/MocA family oxidoreductase, partial [Verrucomicrobiota bacterium]